MMEKDAADTEESHCSARLGHMGLSPDNLRFRAADGSKAPAPKTGRPGMTPVCAGARAELSGTPWKASVARTRGAL